MHLPAPEVGCSLAFDAAEEDELQPPIRVYVWGKGREGAHPRIEVTSQEWQRVVTVRGEMGGVPLNPGDVRCEPPVSEDSDSD